MSQPHHTQQEMGLLLTTHQGWAVISYGWSGHGLVGDPGEVRDPGCGSQLREVLP